MNIFYGGIFVGKETLKRNEVTPIGVQDIMQDFFEKKKYL